MRNIRTTFQMSVKHQPDIVRAIRDTIKLLPNAIKKKALSHRVIIGKNMRIAAPHLADDVVYDTHDQIGETAIGLFCYESKNIYLSQEYYDRDARQWEPVIDNPPHTFLHELGHAIHSDMRTAQNKEFLAAYKSDLKALKGRLKRRKRKGRISLISALKSYLPRSVSRTAEHDKLSSAADEVFAEGFALIMHGIKNSCCVEDSKAFLKNFPLSISYIEGFILEMSPEAELYPEDSISYPSTVEEKEYMIAMGEYKDTSKLKLPFQFF